MSIKLVLLTALTLSAASSSAQEIMLGPVAKMTIKVDPRAQDGQFSGPSKIQIFTSSAKAIAASEIAFRTGRFIFLSFMHRQKIQELPAVTNVERALVKANNQTLDQNFEIDRSSFFSELIIAEQLRKSLALVEQSTLFNDEQRAEVHREKVRAERAVAFGVAAYNRVVAHIQDKIQARIGSLNFPVPMPILQESTEGMKD